jgi:hypothetical protein
VSEVEPDGAAIWAGIDAGIYFFRAVDLMKKVPRARAQSTVTQTMAQVMYQGTPAPRSVATGSDRIRFCPRAGS